MRVLLLILLLNTSAPSFGQLHSAFEMAMQKNFPQQPAQDGRWVFDIEDNNITRLRKPHVAAVLPGYDFYKVTMSNHLGTHSDEGTCLVLYDSVRNKLILVEPLWYHDINPDFVQLFIGKRFATKAALLDFLNEMHELMETGSQYKFVNTGFDPGAVSFNLHYFSGDAYTTNAAGVSSTVNYNQDGVWRQIRVGLKDLKIVRYVSINPATKEESVIQ